MFVKILAGMKIAILSSILLACVSIAPQKLDTKERFMALSFWQSHDSIRSVGFYQNDRLLFKRKALISVQGNAASANYGKILAVKKLLDPYFDLTLVNGYKDNADIYLLMDYAHDTRWNYVVDRQNMINQITIKRTGEMRYMDPILKFKSYKTSYIPYKHGDVLDTPQFTSVCQTDHFYEDIKLQKQTFWSKVFNINVVTSTTPKITRIADYSIAQVFAGADPLNDPASAKWREQWSTAKFEQIIEPCLFEELIHSLTFWRDLPDANGRHAFSGQGGKQQGDMTAYVAAYNRDIPEVLEMLSYYNLPGMKPGLSYDKVWAIINK